MGLLDVLGRMVRESMDGLLNPDMSVSSSAVGEESAVWQSSSSDLLGGVDVTDFTGTSSGPAFDALFLR